MISWNPDFPVRYLDQKINVYFREHANYLLQYLKNNILRVVLIPASEKKFHGHMIRAVESENPLWYRKLIDEHNHFRRDRSCRALDRIRENKDGLFRVSPYKYDAIYRELILERLTEGYEEAGYDISANEEVQDYFSGMFRSKNRF